MTDRNNGKYLNDGSGCEECNFTGRFGGWINNKWRSYPQIDCSACKPMSPDERTKSAA